MSGEGRWGRRAPWVLLLVLLGIRLGLNAWQCPWVAVHPDVALWNPGAKHWAFYGEWAWHDISFELLAPAQAWLAGGVFRIFGPSYEASVWISQAASALLLVAILLLLRDEPPLARGLAVLLVWGDAAFSQMAYLGTNEATLELWLGLSALILAARPPSAGVWLSAGACLALAVFTKPTALLFGPAAAAAAWLRPEPARRARLFGAFALGGILASAPFLAFIGSHGDAFRSAWRFLKSSAGDHDRTLLESLGAFLFSGEGLGWRNPMLPLLLLAVPAWWAKGPFRGALAGASGVGASRDQALAWFALTGLAGLFLFPAAPSRYVMCVLPLGILAAKALSEGGWDEAEKRLSGRRVLWLFAWGAYAAMPVFSCIKDGYLRDARAAGVQGVGPEVRAGFLLLGGVALCLPLAAWTMRRASLAASASAGWLLAGAGLLAGTDLVVTLSGPVGRAGAPWLSSGLHRASATGLLASLIGMAAVAVAFRLWGRKAGAGAFLRAAGFVLLALALLLPAKRFWATRYPDKRLGEIAATLGRHIPPDATVYGDTWSMVLLLPVRCRVVTPWTGLPWQIEAYERSMAEHRWNLPIERFDPGFLLLANEEEIPLVRRIWEPRLGGYDRELLETVRLDRDGVHTDVIRLYRLKRR